MTSRARENHTARKLGTGLLPHVSSSAQRHQLMNSATNWDGGQSRASPRPTVPRAKSLYGGSRHIEPLYTEPLKQNYFTTPTNHQYIQIVPSDDENVYTKNRPQKSFIGKQKRRRRGSLLALCGCWGVTGLPNPDERRSAYSGIYNFVDEPERSSKLQTDPRRISLQPMPVSRYSEAILTGVPSDNGAVTPPLPPRSPRSRKPFVEVIGKSRKPLPTPNQEKVPLLDVDHLSPPTEEEHCKKTGEAAGRSKSRSSSRARRLTRDARQIIQRETSDDAASENDESKQDESRDFVTIAEKLRTVYISGNEKHRKTPNFSPPEMLRTSKKKSRKSTSEGGHRLDSVPQTTLELSEPRENREKGDDGKRPTRKKIENSVEVGSDRLTTNAPNDRFQSPSDLTLIPEDAFPAQFENIGDVGRGEFARHNSVHGDRLVKLKSSHAKSSFQSVRAKQRGLSNLPTAAGVVRPPPGFESSV